MLSNILLILFILLMPRLSSAKTSRLDAGIFSSCRPTTADTASKLCARQIYNAMSLALNILNQRVDAMALAGRTLV